MTAAVEEYAGGIAVDSSRIESALSGIDPSNPEAMQEVLSSGVLVPEDTQPSARRWSGWRLCSRWSRGG